MIFLQEQSAIDSFIFNIFLFLFEILNEASPFILAVKFLCNIYFLCVRACELMILRVSFAQDFGPQAGQQYLHPSATCTCREKQCVRFFVRNETLLSYTINKFLPHFYNYYVIPDVNPFNGKPLKPLMGVDTGCCRYDLVSFHYSKVQVKIT